jgi:hypothetical protein
MRSEFIGPIVVAVFVFFFGFLLFRGMVFEWHRRDGELRGQSH